MKYLIEDKHRYAAKLLAENLVGNVESAIRQAETDLSTNSNILYSNFEEFYLIHNDEWYWPYIVKKSALPGKTDVSIDKNVKRYKW